MPKFEQCINRPVEQQLHILESQFGLEFCRDLFAIAEEGSKQYHRIQHGRRARFQWHELSDEAQLSALNSAFNALVATEEQVFYYGEQTLDDSFVETAAGVVHEGWLRSALTEPATPEEREPYAELGPEDQEKDRIFVDSAVGRVTRKIRKGKYQGPPSYLAGIWLSEDAKAFNELNDEMRISEYVVPAISDGPAGSISLFVTTGDGVKEYQHDSLYSAAYKMRRNLDARLIQNGTREAISPIPTALGHEALHDSTLATV